MDVYTHKKIYIYIHRYDLNRATYISHKKHKHENKNKDMTKQI